MPTRTSTRTSTTVSSQRTRQKSLERPNPFNKRPSESDHGQASPIKMRKLSHSESATRTFSTEIPAKALASALKRRQESITLGKVMPIPIIPADRSPGKVRFLGQESMEASRRSSKEQPHRDSQTSGDIVQVVVQIPGPADGSEDRSSQSPQQKIDHVADNEDETNIVATTRIEQFPNPARKLDADFKGRYFRLKDRAWTWVQDYFDNVSPEAKASLCLVNLARAFPQLMEYANGVSRCGQKQTWEVVFNEQRAPLVYGILGKILEVHVFTHEMFGADTDQLRELRELDAELVYKDGFYRQRCRAHRILAFLPDPNSPPPNFHRSLTLLHASIIEMLSPLLPSPPPADLQPQLLAILLDAASLSLSMRRERTVVYHWEPHPAVGSLFEAKRMHILNGVTHHEEDDYRRNTDSEVVTMTGWPGCVAYRPDANDGHTAKKKKGGKPRLGVNRIGRAEVCVTFGPAVKPLSVEPENWLGKSLRVEMTERDQAKSAVEKTVAVAKRAAGLGAGVGIAVSAVLGLQYVVGNPWIREEVVEYLGSFV